MKKVQRIAAGLSMILITDFTARGLGIDPCPIGWNAVCIVHPAIFIVYHSSMLTLVHFAGMPSLDFVNHCIVLRV
jgi:hypothetical protein